MIRISAFLVALLLWAAPSFAQQPTVSPEQRALIRQVLIDLLRSEPELVLEALQALEAREQAATQARQTQGLSTRKAELERDASDLVTGNPNGDVTLVEFFDYRCPFCKRAQPAIDQAVRADGRVRLVHKQYPILGPESVLAARAVGAAGQQNKALDLHRALMALPGQLTEAELFRVARSVGLDETRLRRDMTSPAVDEHLRRTIELGRALDIRGTPAFIVGNRLIPGAVDADTLIAAITAARTP